MKNTVDAAIVTNFHPLPEHPSTHKKYPDPKFNLQCTRDTYFSKNIYYVCQTYFFFLRVKCTRVKVVNTEPLRLTRKSLKYRPVRTPHYYPIKKNRIKFNVLVVEVFIRKLVF